VPYPRNSQNPMPTKRKTVKTRKAGNPPAPQTTKSEREGEPPLPPVEWLAEMASRVWKAGPKPVSIVKRGLDYGWVDAAERALAAYKAAHHVLHYEKISREINAEVDQVLEALKPELTQDEIGWQRVSFYRACKLITGEERKDRAEERFVKLTYWLYSEIYWYDPETQRNEPPPEYEKKKSIKLREVAELKRQFIKMEKIPKKVLVQTLSQFGFYSRPPEKKTGQEREKS
jgi:hypothetical protein